MKKSSFTQPAIESETIESLSAKLLATTSQLMESNHRLQEIQKERNEMLANISHDLRAPITAIRSAIDYMNSSASLSAEDLQSSLQLIDRRTKTLEDLIQDMYYLFCVEDTSRELNLETVDAASFFEEYFFDATIDSRYDVHNMDLIIEKNVKCDIHIDIQKIVRVLDNLLTNAAKYSPEGTDITLKISYQEEDRMVLAEVIDNGPGIPADAVSRLFHRTYTVSSARTPNSSTGSGLGLSIVKAIVERHEGEVGCKSIEGEGSCFWFKISGK